MKDLTFTRDRRKSIIGGTNQIKELQKLCSLEVGELKEIGDIDNIRDSLYGNTDFNESISLYLHYFKKMKDPESEFSDSVGLHRLVHMRIAYNYKLLGNRLDKQNDLEGSIDAYQKAVVWFQYADRTIGYQTMQLFVEQLGCIKQATYNRMQLGLEDEMTKWLIDRQMILMPAASYPKHLINLDRNLPECVSEMVEEVTEDIMRGHLRNYPFHGSEIDPLEITLETIADITGELDISSEINL